MFSLAGGWLVTISHLFKKLKEKNEKDLSDARDQVYAILEEHIKELGRDVPPVGKQFTVEPFGQDSPHLWVPVVHIGTCETEGYHLQRYKNNLRLPTFYTTFLSRTGVYTDYSDRSGSKNAKTFLRACARAQSKMKSL